MMDAFDRTAILRAWRRTAVNDNSYVLRAYTAAHTEEILEALGWPRTSGLPLLFGFADLEVRGYVIRICDERLADEAGEWSNAT